MEEFQNVTQGRVPAEETLRRLAEGDKKFNYIEKTMTDLNLKFELMNKDIQEIKEGQKRMEDAFLKFCDSCDTKYASKSFEAVVTKILWALGFLVLGAIGTAIFKLIFK